MVAATAGVQCPGSGKVEIWRRQTSDLDISRFCASVSVSTLFPLQQHDRHDYTTTTTTTAGPRHADPARGHTVVTILKLDALDALTGCSGWMHWRGKPCHWVCHTSGVVPLNFNHSNLDTWSPCLFDWISTTSDERLWRRGAGGACWRVFATRTRRCPGRGHSSRLRRGYLLIKYRPAPPLRNAAAGKTKNLKT